VKLVGINYDEKREREKKEEKYKSLEDIPKL
jgi:hypothetical protein